MTKPRPKRSHYNVVVYSPSHWKLLFSLRLSALKVMELLEKNGIPSWVIGSVARGDIKPTSDIDIFIDHPVDESFMKYLLDPAELELVQGTRMLTPRIVYHIDETIKVTVPLFNYSTSEIEFMKYAGEIGIKEIHEKRRVPGVNKELLLIMPTDEGHVEESIIGRESEVARILGVSPRVVRERVSVLMRRAEKGRSGVLLRIYLPPTESATERYYREVKRNPSLRRY